MNRKLKWGVISLIVIGAGVGIYLYKNQQQISSMDIEEQKKESIVESSSQKKVLNVNALIIKPVVLTDNFNTTGVLIPDEMVDLSFESSGQVVEINFEEGSTVQKGDLLARINSSQLVAERKRLTAQLKLAQDRVYRQAALLKKDAVSQEALELVQTALATLQADIAIIDAQIELTDLRAPFTGTIGLRQISVGSYATPTTVVAKLTRKQPLKLEFTVPERYASSIKQGTNLSFKVEGELQQFYAKVYAMESTIDPELHQYSVRAIYPNRNGHLMPGRYAAVSINKEEIEDAIAVPAEALVPEMGRDKVFLYRSGKAEPVEIITGIRTEDRVQAIKGLNVGDTLIISGTLQLRTGLDVVIDEIE